MDFVQRFLLFGAVNVLFLFGDKKVTSPHNACRTKIRATAN